MVRTNHISSHSAVPAVQHRWWIRWLHRSIARVYFGRVHVAGREHLPIGGALLVANHRNGMLDGSVLIGVDQRWTFMVGANLARHPLLRYVVDGLVVERAGESIRRSSTEQTQSRAANREALATAAVFVADGGTLCVFPEGTSSLGPHLLPLHPGVAAIYVQQRVLGGAAPLIPVGVHYPQGAAFRGTAEIMIGPPFHPVLATTGSASEQRQLVLAQVEAALTAVTVNVGDDAEQHAVEALATLAVAGTSLSHGAVCRALARGLGDGDPTARYLQRWWAALDAASCTRSLWRVGGVPLFPTGSLWRPLLSVVLLAPVVASAGVINLPIIVAACTAARRRADDTNVVALWRVLAGVPTALAWWGLLALLLVLLFGSSTALLILAGTLACTGAGVLSWRCWRDASVALFNALRAPALVPYVHALRKETHAWLQR